MERFYQVFSPLIIARNSASVSTGMPSACALVSLEPVSYTHLTLPTMEAV